MDGGKKKLTGSLQFRLSHDVSGADRAAGHRRRQLSYITAFDEAIEWQDANLRQNVGDDRRPQREGSTCAVTIIDTIPSLISRVVVRCSARRTSPTSAARSASPARPTACRPSMSTARPGACMRRTGKRQPARGRPALRGSATRSPESALQAIVSPGGLLPVLIALISVVVANAQADDGAGRDLDQRTEHDLARSWPAPCRTRLRPFVASINKLFARLDGALAGQRRFVAVAAHELRSPLTA